MGRWVFLIRLLDFYILSNEQTSLSILSARKTNTSELPLKKLTQQWRNEFLSALEKGSREMKDGRS